MRKLFASPFFGAVVGGAIVAGVMLAAAGNDTRIIRTTVVEQSPLARDVGSTPASSGGALTPGEIYARDARGVVHITATVASRAWTPFSVTPAAQRDTQTGSGFVIDRDGVILTNAHLVAGAVRITVAFEGDRTVAAKVIGRDPDDDLALLKVDPDGIRLVPLPLGDSSTVRVGDPTAAIGNPFGLECTLTTGIVSALQRSIRAPNDFSIDNVIQTDTPIDPGSSGGPLLNAEGRVIGINSQIYTGRGSVGIAFAIPIDTAIAVIAQLRRSGRVSAGGVPADG